MKYLYLINRNFLFKNKKNVSIKILNSQYKLMGDVVKSLNNSNSINNIDIVKTITTSSLVVNVDSNKGIDIDKYISSLL